MLDNINKTILITMNSKEQKLFNKSLLEALKYNSNKEKMERLIVAYFETYNRFPNFPIIDLFWFDYDNEEDILNGIKDLVTDTQYKEIENYLYNTDYTVEFEYNFDVRTNEKIIKLNNHEFKYKSNINESLEILEIAWYGLYTPVLDETTAKEWKTIAKDLLNSIKEQVKESMQ